MAEGGGSRVLPRRKAGGPPGAGRLEAWQEACRREIDWRALASHLRGMSEDHHAPLRDELMKQVLEGPGHTAPALRAAAARGEGLPEELRELVRKIHRHAYKVTDEDLARLKARYSDDELFEVIVSAAMGASLERLLAGLRALKESK